MMVQSEETGSTISRLWPVNPDHARMPVMLPRKSDSDMRRDGSNAACEQPDQAIDERGRVRGVPDLEHFAGLRTMASRRVAFTVMEEEWRWRRLAGRRAQIRGRDKSARCAAWCGRVFSGAYGASARGAPDRRSLRIRHFAKDFRAIARCAGPRR
ncbi:hypothetical protein [Phyllobacterium sp. K27]